MKKSVEKLGRLVQKLGTKITGEGNLDDLKAKPGDEVSYDNSSRYQISRRLVTYVGRDERGNRLVIPPDGEGTNEMLFNTETGESRDKDPRRKVSEREIPVQALGRDYRLFRVERRLSEGKKKSR